MITKHLIYCKKTFIVKSLNEYEIGRIEKNKTYYYYSENNRIGTDIFVYYDEDNIHYGSRGYTFYYDLHNHNTPIGVNILYPLPFRLISDYFYSDVELRKLKIKKINEQSKMFEEC